MNDLVSRYIYDVVRRLPEKERKDVERELEANIYDMMPENASQAEIEEVLYSLGAPSALAAQYRQKPGYLISPDIYNDYVNALKRIVPLVGVILLIVGFFVGAGNAFKSGDDYGVRFIQMVLSTGISTGIQGAFHAFFWTTLGFAIADRKGYKPAQAGKEWTLDDLPEETPQDKYTIKMSESIVEIVFTAIFAVLGIMFFTGTLPLVIASSSTGVMIRGMFSPQFMQAMVIIIIVSVVFALIENAAKIAVRRWTPLVCGAAVLSSIVGIICAGYILTIPQVFTPEFSAVIEQSAFGKIVFLSFFGSKVQVSPVFIIAAIIIVTSVVEIIQAVYYTVKASAVAE